MVKNKSASSRTVERVGGIFDTLTNTLSHELEYEYAPIDGIEHRAALNGLTYEVNNANNFLKAVIGDEGISVDRDSNYGDNVYRNEVEGDIKGIQADREVNETSQYLPFVYDIQPVKRVQQNSESNKSAEDNSVLTGSSPDDGPSSLDDEGYLSSSSSSSPSDTMFSHESDDEIEDNEKQVTHSQEHNDQENDGDTQFVDIELDLMNKNDTKQWVGVIDQQQKQMYLYPPTSISHMKKDSIVNLMDIAEAVGCEYVYVYVQKSNEDFQQYARALIYSGFQMIPPQYRKPMRTSLLQKAKNPDEWVLFGTEL